MSSTPPKRWSIARASVVIVSSATLVLGAGGFAAWSYVQADNAEASYDAAKKRLKVAQDERDLAQADHDERVAAEREAADVKAREERERKAALEAQASQDSFYASIGYENVGNNVYFHWLDPSEYSCGNWDCGGFAVIAVDGCPSGLYLEAGIMSGGTQVGWTNNAFAGLAPGGTAAGVFEMISASGDSFSLTDVNCY